MNLDQLNREVKYRTARSSSAGGQHVNKVETKVELLFNVDASKTLTDEQKQSIKAFAANRINKDGLLIVMSQEKRTQILNKAQAWNKFVKLIHKATTPTKKRKYKPIKANKQNRLNNKKRQSEKKQMRKKIDF